MAATTTRSPAWPEPSPGPYSALTRSGVNSGKNSGPRSRFKARVATLENVFTWEGNVCHEIAHKIAWKRIDAFGAGGDILYPEALATLLRG